MGVNSLYGLNWALCLDHFSTSEKAFGKPSYTQKGPFFSFQRKVAKRIEHKLQVPCKMMLQGVHAKCIDDAFRASQCNLYMTFVFTTCSGVLYY